MIFYFSATGNCKYVASRVSAGTNEAMVSITDCMKNGQYRFSIKQEESIGIVAPTYFFKLPAIVCDFLEMKLPGFAGRIYYKNYDKQRTTDHFHVETSCVGCGLCAEKCPVDAIEIQDGKPVWTKDKCLACLGCLHRCPSFSIQYGKKTEKHGQYINPHVLSYE